MNAFDETIEYIHEEIKRMTATTTLDNEFYPIRQNLTNTRLGLRRLGGLASETVTMSKAVRIFFTSPGRLGNQQALEVQMGVLEAFIDRSIPILQMAEREYRSASKRLKEFEPMMLTLVTQLNRLLDKNSDEHAAYAASLRGGAYGGAAAGTTGMVIADVFGCLGKNFLSYSAYQQG